MRTSMQWWEKQQSGKKEETFGGRLVDLMVISLKWMDWTDVFFLVMAVV